MRDDVHRRSLRRRDILGLAVFAATLAGAAASRADPAACEAEDTDDGRAAMRLTLEYVSPSKIPGKACAGCQFYTAAVPNCGKCQLINGPVSADAVCSSWAPKK
jgi:hypothetical protein